MSEDSEKLEGGYERRLGLVGMGFVLPSGKLCWSLGSKASRREERGAEFFARDIRVASEDGLGPRETQC